MLTATEYALAPFAAVGLVTIVSKLHDTFKFFLRPQGGYVPPEDAEPLAVIVDDGRGRGTFNPEKGGFTYFYEPAPDCRAVWVDNQKVWERDAEVTSSDEMELVQHATGKVLKRSEKPKIDACPGHSIRDVRDNLADAVKDQMDGRPLKAHRLFTAEYLDPMPAKPLWDKKDCLVNETDGMLRQHVPNIGGVGNVPYAGPNYTSEDDLADEMRGVWHFGFDPNGDK